jgi:hypothetical protein
MNNIEQYKNRFFNLMESTIGDVRPLITEQINPDDIKEYKGKWSISNMMKNEVSKKMYKDAIDKNTKISGEEDATVVDYYNRMVNDNRLDNLVTMYDKEFPSGTQSSELGNSPITNVEDLKGDDLKKFYNAMIATYEGNETFEGMTIFSTLLNNREKNIDIKRLQDYINQSTGENYNLIDIYNKLSDKEALASEGANIKKR